MGKEIQVKNPSYICSVVAFINSKYSNAELPKETLSKTMAAKKKKKEVILHTILLREIHLRDEHLRIIVKATVFFKV